MSNKLHRAKALGTDNESKKPERVGPPWAPKSVRPPAVVVKSELDEAFAKAKDASDVGRLSDSRADFIASTLALVKKKKGSKPETEAQTSVGNEGLDKVIGPPWSAKEFQPARQETVENALAQMEMAPPKRG